MKVKELWEILGTYVRMGHGNEDVTSSRSMELGMEKRIITSCDICKPDYPYEEHIDLGTELER